jgi:type 1 glutamine amidotransferase
MIGGWFEHHPKGTPTATLTVFDAKHPATAKLPKTIGPPGETDVNPNPNTWYHAFGGGRVFYTGLGHTAESYQEPYLVDLLTGALRWAVAGK